MILISNINEIGSLSIKEIEEGGIVFSKIGTAKMLQGKIIVKIDSGLDLTDTKNIIEDAKEGFEKICNKMESEHKGEEITIDCQLLAQNIQHQSNLINGSIRPKRSTGLFGLLHDIIFGVDESELHLEQFKSHQHDWNSAARDVMAEFVGTLNSSNKAMTDKVNELQTTLINVTENLRQVQKWKTPLNMTLLNQYMITAYLKTKAVIDTIRARYDEVRQHMLTKDELQEYAAKLSSSLQVLRDPSERYDRTMVQEKGRVKIKYTLRLVSQENYDVLMGIPIPENGTIIQLDKSYLILDHTAMTYLEFKSLEEMREIEANRFIIENRVLNKADDHLTCLSASILRKPKTSKLCKLMKIMDNYDIMIKPSKDESLIILTTYPESAFVICNRTRTIIKHTKSLVTLDAGCSIHTYTSTYTAGTSLAETRNTYFFQKMGNLLNETELQSLANFQATTTNLSPQLNAIDITKLNNRIFNLREAEPYTDPTFYFYLLGMMTVIILIIVILSLYCYCTMRLRVLTAKVQTHVQEIHRPHVPETHEPIKEWPELV